MIDQDTLVRALLSERIKLLGYIQSLVRRPGLAADIFQDVCVLALQKREQIHDEAHLLNWMRTAARLQTLNIIRKRQEQNLSLDQDVMDLMESSWKRHDAPKNSALADALRGCMALLSAKQRTLVDKRFIQDYKLERLAEETNRSMNSLYVTFSRIYSALGKCISQKLAVVEGVRLG